jgi:hypothetical protein
MAKNSRLFTPIFIGYFVSLDVDYQRQKGDHIPLKWVAAAQDAQRLLGNFGLVHGLPPIYINEGLYQRALFSIAF